MLNDEPELLALLADVLAIDEDAVWAVDVADGMATLLINVLLNHGQRLVYITGLAVNGASAGYRGMGKTDAKDATVIADQTSDAVWSQAATANPMGLVGKAVASL